MSNVLSVGDILEVSCKGGVGYFSYAGKHSWLGDAICVVPRLYGSGHPAWGTIFEDVGYFTFYPVHAALRQKLVRKVGYAIEAMRPIPEAVRTAVNKDKSGRVTSWLITDGSARTPRRDADMSKDERLLPIGSIWNHELLCRRIEQGWSPEG